MATTARPQAAPAPNTSEQDGVPRAAEPPLASYALLTTVFNAGFLGALYAGRERLPERFSAGDLALMAIGTHKLSRLVTKQKVTSTLRAPFTEPKGRGDLPAEVSERPAGRGMRRAIGELLTCPYCLDQWIAGSYVAGMVFAPRATRAVASMFTVVAGADVLQQGYRRIQER